VILSLTISRASLSLADLVITNDPTQPFHLPEDGLEEPDVTYRLAYMPDSRDVHGKELVAAALEHSAIPATIYAKAADSATLATLKAELRAALGQFSYDVTLNLDGATATYSADPCGPRWGAVDSGMVKARMAKASVTIPVYPIAS
jgi:hypothetical protein